MTATTTPSPSPSPSPRPKATTPPPPSPTPLTPVTFNGLTASSTAVSFDYDPSLGDAVYVHALSLGEVPYTRFAFAPDGDCREVGCVEVYPVDQYREAFPDWPLPPVGAATVLRAQSHHLAFHNGSGTRSIRMYGQNVFWANNEDVLYDYQGSTEDRQHYVLVTFPIDTPILLTTSDPSANTNEAAVPVPSPLPEDFAQLDAAVGEYNRAAERALDLLAPPDFSPSLDALDALVASLRIEPVPAAPPKAGAFRLVSLVPPELLGEVTGLKVDSDGTVRVFATYGYATRYSGLSDGGWTVHPSDRDHILIGTDDGGRMFLFSKADDKITTWDGGPDYLLADAGWLPVPDPNELEGQGVLTDGSGQVWLATERDVRVFDGAKWTVFSPQDMTMASPPHADVLTWFTMHLIGADGEVWAGACNWGGPGPTDGGGACWFDGQAWQGADSLLASGCVLAIQEDGLGRVWVGVDADLVRYDPAADEWAHFPPPLPPEGYRFGYIIDIALDPAGDPWPLFALCGGASCVGEEARYRLRDGAWTQIGDIGSNLHRTLLFDGAGTPWLLGGGVYRVEADRPADLPAALLVTQAAAVDGAGRVWVAGWQVGITGVQPATDVGLWVLEPQAPPGASAGSPDPCPLPGDGQPPEIVVVEGKSVEEMFESQILAYLNAGGNAQSLQAALSRLSLTDSSGTNWQSKTQALATDVTGDGTPEMVIDLSFFVEGQFANGAVFVYRCQAGQYVGGTVAPIAGQVFSGSDPDPGIRDILDMNGNGKPELVFSTIPVIGTHANFARHFRILEWDGSQFVDLIRSDRDDPHVAEVQNGDGEIRDTNRDGFFELVLTNGEGRGPDADPPDQPTVDVWAWDGQAFTLAYSEELLGE